MNGNTSIDKAITVKSPPLFRLVLPPSTELLEDHRVLSDRSDELLLRLPLLVLPWPQLPQPPTIDEDE